ncbi:hypothetical protein BKG93_08330 [Rodentibacter ratti]|uniref:DUF805 domain-containing protein n=2 Tax=Rodentibacter ratti TaxID=1906745 RepID=A0A1V3L387_9PAST|nr:hypothetical protein BKG93_08330 [Rodentibacter ratti]
MTKEKSLFTYYIEGVSIKNYLNINGRARKREYWGGYLFGTINAFILLILAITGVGAIPAFILLLALLPPLISVTVRRLHDANKSGWFALSLLVMLIPGIGEVIGLIITIIIGVLEGTKGENQYGKDPLENTDSQTKDLPSDSNPS